MRAATLNTPASSIGSKWIKTKKTTARFSPSMTSLLFPARLAIIWPIILEQDSFKIWTIFQFSNFVSDLIWWKNKHKNISCILDCFKFRKQIITLEQNQLKKRNTKFEPARLDGTGMKILCSGRDRVEHFVPFLTLPLEAIRWQFLYLNCNCIKPVTCAGFEPTLV